MMPAQLGEHVTEAMPPPIVRGAANAGCAAIATTAAKATPIDFMNDTGTPKTRTEHNCSTVVYSFVMKRAIGRGLRKPNIFWGLGWELFRAPNENFAGWLYQWA